jgi:hypothetical protein
MVVPTSDASAPVPSGVERDELVRLLGGEGAGGRASAPASAVVERLDCLDERSGVSAKRVFLVDRFSCLVRERTSLVVKRTVVS